MQPADTIPQAIVKSSADVYNVCRRIHEREGNNFQEFFYALFLNRSNKTIGYYVASMGGVTGTVADPRLILKAAILSNCTTLALCHNHPSGSTRPSMADEQLTSKIKQAAQYCDIRTIEHIILGEDEYFSFADEGLI